MIIRIKLFLIMLLAFALNLLIVLGYYRFSLSGEISQSYTLTQRKLDEETKLITADLKDESNREQRLEQIAEENGFVVSLENELGETIFQAGNSEGNNIDFFASSIIRGSDGVYLIKIMRSVPIDNLPTMGFMQKLMIAEVVIVLGLLSLLTAAIYFSFFRPIMSVQDDMNNFHKGIKPLRTKRSDEIGWLKNRFVELTDSLDQEKQKQNNIIAAISHDIKTPLTSVMGYAEQLRKGQLSPDRQNKYLDIIYGKAQNIRDLINDFDEYLDYNLRNAMKKVKITAGQLNQIIQEEYSYELENMGVKFTTLCECPEAVLLLDLTNIRRVFGNIISNSLKHATHKDLMLSVNSRLDPEGILFSISDNGAGVSEEELPKLFNPLYSSDPNRKVAGLGLSICKSIIESHDGKIWAINNPSGGLLICFTLNGDGSLGQVGDGS